MRTCHFTTNKKQKRSFYLALVRSIFEHCSIVWSPQQASHIAKFDMIQKRAIKWIDGHPFECYTKEDFINKQRLYNILPMELRFRLNDLKLLYKTVNSQVPINLPNYITFVDNSRTRHTRRTAAIIDGDDTTTLHCSIVPTCDAFKNSYFYRTMLIWNKLPLSVRQASGISSFKTKLIEYFWPADRDWPD